jgi:hypothetical protein
VKGKRQNDDILKQNLYPLTLILGPQRILEKRFLSSEERAFPLSSDKSRERGFRNGPGSTDPIALQTSLRDMIVHKTEETPQISTTQGLSKELGACDLFYRRD